MPWPTLEAVNRAASYRPAVAEDCGVEARLGEAGQAGACRFGVRGHHLGCAARVAPSSSGSVAGEQHATIPVWLQERVKELAALDAILARLDAEPGTDDVAGAGAYVLLPIAQIHHPRSAP